MAFALIGPMGVGKTTYGKKLAKQLNLRFADTDKIIVSEHGAIAEIFAQQGEPRMRELETAALTMALDEFDLVATGGGIVLSSANRQLLSAHTVIYLATDAEFIHGKINTRKRPLLREDPEAWERIFLERKPLYEELADYTVFTGGRALKETMAELTAIIEKEIG